MNDAKKLFDTVVDKDLCTLCGTCIGVCPTNALNFYKNTLSANENLCVSCGKCNAVCPGADFSYSLYNGLLFLNEDNINSLNIGYYTHIYKGWATDSDIRISASSGGAVTAILCSLIKSNVIDGAVVIRETTMGAYEPIIARTESEILASSQSKYQFIPTNTIINFLLQQPGKYAYVGLPCQVQGLRKAMEETTLLKEKISYIFGIFCGFNMFKEATDFLIKKSSISANKIKSLEYRSNQDGETGFKIVSDDDEVYFLPKHNYTFLNFFFSAERCMKCYDLTAEFADISFGDAWEYENCSRIIVRNKIGDSALNCALQDGLYIEDSSEQDILSTQMQLIKHKKKYIVQRAKLFKNFPEYDTEYVTIGTVQKVKACVFYYLYHICSGTLGKTIINLIPMKLLGWSSNFIRGILSGSSRAVILYLFTGALATLFNFLGFIILNLFLDFRIANFIAIIITKPFVYYTNKKIVFKSKTVGAISSIKEFFRFILARGFTGAVDFFGLILLVQVFLINENIGKGFLIVLTTILNYMIGKKRVFVGEK